MVYRTRLGHLHLLVPVQLRQSAPQHRRSHSDDPLRVTVQSHTPTRVIMLQTACRSRSRSCASVSAGDDLDVQRRREGQALALKACWPPAHTVAWHPHPGLRPWASAWPAEWRFCWTGLAQWKWYSALLTCSIWASGVCRDRQAIAAANARARITTRSWTLWRRRARHVGCMDAVGLNLQYTLASSQCKSVTIHQ